MKITMVRGLAAAAFVAMGAIGALDGGAASAKAAARPIKGTAHGGIAGVTAGGALVFEYTGNSSHLGSYTRHEEATVAYPNLSGTIVFTAANGDVLKASFTGAFLNGGLTDAAGTYTFVGGSGRFADATGTAAFTAHAPNFGDVSVSFEGTIGY